MIGAWKALENCAAVPRRKHMKSAKNTKAKLTASRMSFLMHSTA